MLFKKRIKWLYVFAVWVILGLLSSLQSYHYREKIGSPVAWSDIIVGDVGYFVLWFLLSIPVIQWINRWPVQKANWILRLPLYICAGFIIAFLNRGFYSAILYAIREGGVDKIPLDSLYRTIIGFFDQDVFIYFIIFFVVHALIYYSHLQKEKEQSEVLQNQLVLARLQALQRQLHPHFLFNTLNTVSGLVESNPHLAKLTLGRLGDLLRMLLENDKQPEITVREELKFIDLYLKLQVTRFGDRLKVEKKLGNDIEHAFLPTFLLQPLLENAIQYGVSSIPGESILVIEIHKHDEWLDIEITNTCKHKSGQNDFQGFGIGLSNSNERLMQLYGENHHFTISIENDEAVVNVRIPYKTSIQSA